MIGRDSESEVKVGLSAEKMYILKFCVCMGGMLTGTL
jgi:hypothetical protein